MADMRNRTPFYGAVPTSKLNADHVFMADGSTLQEQADKKFELIEELTLTEDAALIERTTEPDGTAYNFSDLIITSVVPNTSANAAQGVYTINTFNYGISNTIRANSEAYNRFIYTIKNGIGIDLITGGTSQNTQSGFNGHMKADFIDNISSVKIASNPATIPFPVGTLFEIYAVRA